jgi:hypothetical protein
MVRPDGGALFPLLCSVCGGLLGWGGLALVTQRFVTIESVNPAVYRELCSRFALLKAQMKVVEQELHERHGDGLDHVPDRVNISYALAEVHMYLARLGFRIVFAKFWWLRSAEGVSSQEDALASLRYLRP